MAHDPLFEQRIADSLKAQGAKAEPKKMFGGVAFMVNGNMSVGITNKGDFMVRFEQDRHEEASTWPGAKPMTFGKGGRRGFLFVDADAVESGSALDKWVSLSLAYMKGLPKKTARVKTKNPSQASKNPKGKKSV